MEQLLEGLLGMKVKTAGKNGPVLTSPTFRVEVQEEGSKGVLIIIHPLGEKGPMLHFWVKGNVLTPR